MKCLAILGASGHGKVVADIAESCGWDNIVFFDDAWPSLQDNAHWPVVGDTDSLLVQLTQFDGVIVGIGNNIIRQLKTRALHDAGAKIVSLVHPEATVSRYASLGNGSVVMAGVVINVDVVTGQGAILNTGCSIDHDTILGDFVHISPGARLAGSVQIGDLSWVGIGASVRQLVCIGQKVTVGASAAVVNHVLDGLTVVGVPARAL